MARTERLLRRKKRLTCRITHRDNRRLAKGKPVREQTILRAAIYKVDVALERAGRIGDGAAPVR